MEKMYNYKNLMYFYAFTIKYHENLVTRTQIFSTFMSKCTIYRCFITFYIVYKTEIDIKQLTNIKIVL